MNPIPTAVPSMLFAPHVRSTFAWRFAHACLPLGQRLNPCLRWALGNHSYLRVPWGRYWLTIRGEWLRLRSSASAPIYRGPRHQNPEYFAIVRPQLSRLQRGAIIDVGANIGAYVLNFCADRAGPIMAFEPDPALYTLLAETVRFNRLASVTPRNVACGDAAGTLSFATGVNGSVVPGQGQPPGAGPGSAEPGRAPAASADPANGLITVPVVRLDDELEAVERVSLIKIDCEGFEWHILNGCMETIRRHRPTLFIELHPKLIGRFGHTLEDVCQLLRPHYQLRFWDTDATERSANRMTRFVGRYRPSITELDDEARMLSVAASEPGPDQLFLLGTPR